jgi:protein-S-isoprenylcysteine O-methyltransferase Ste14
MPRRVVLAASPLIYLLAIAVHLLVPWAVSLLAPRWGWNTASPGGWNMVGLLPIAAGVAGLIWTFAAGVRRWTEVPSVVTLDWTPKLFLRSGPYAFSRNPLYIAELSMWVGSAILLGSATVAAGCAVVWIGRSVLVRREERELEARFGDSYRAYLASVPRWIGRRG